MFPTFHVGPLSIQSPGLFLIIAFWLGMTLAERFTSRNNISADKLTNLVFFSLLVGIVGARLAYLVRFPAAFIESPVSLVSLNPALFDLFGCFSFAILTALIYGQCNKFTVWATLDALTPLFAVTMIGIGFSHLSSGTHFGLPSSWPWTIELWGAKRYPSQIYEIIAGFITLIAIIPDLKKPSVPGIIFFKFLTITSGLHLFIDGFRGDYILLPGNIRSIQVISWFVLAGSLSASEILKKQFNKK